MESIQLMQLWTAGAVLAGFQTAALTWRINREITMENGDERTWVTLADGVVGASFVLLVVGVFVAPLAGSASAGMAAKFLGLAMMLFAASPFVLAGHYNLYCSWGKEGCRPRATNQEWLAAGISAALVVAGAVWVFA